jgi:ketosteroid isomerase-like protein
MDNIEIVRACFAGYLAQDRELVEGLIAADFVFTSPQDDRIGRAAYFERCFPTADRLRSYELLQVVPGDGDDVFAMYEYELLNGDTHRNTEVLTVRDGQIVEVQVFFGGRY